MQILAKVKEKVALKGFNIDQLVSFEWNQGKAKVTKVDTMEERTVPDEKAEGNKFTTKMVKVTKEVTTYEGQELKLTFAGNVIEILKGAEASAVHQIIGRNQSHFASYEAVDDTTVKA